MYANLAASLFWLGREDLQAPVSANGLKFFVTDLELDNKVEQTFIYSWAANCFTQENTQCCLCSSWHNKSYDSIGCLASFLRHASPCTGPNALSLFWQVLLKLFDVSLHFVLVAPCSFLLVAGLETECNLLMGLIFSQVNIQGRVLLGAFAVAIGLRPIILVVATPFNVNFRAVKGFFEERGL